MKLKVFFSLVLVLIVGTAAHAQTTATPVISLATGTYTMPQNTTITDSGATISWCYVNTGTCTPTTMKYTGSIYVNPATTETICANAMATGKAQSALTCAYYSNQATVTATPVISLPTGTYQMPQSTTISDATANATILWCYVNTGTCTPTTMKYTGSIYVNPVTTETICAIATASGLEQSQMACNYYTASSGPISFNYSGGAVTMTTTQPNAEIFYTTDGSTADEASTEYDPADPVTASAGTVFHAVAVTMKNSAGENAVALQNVQASTSGWVTILGCTTPGSGSDPCPANYKSFDTPGINACGPGCGVQGVPSSVNFITGLSSPYAGSSSDGKTLNVNFTAQSSGQVQILWPETGAGDGKQVCNDCLTQVQDMWVFPQSNSGTIYANELDMVNYVNETVMEDTLYGTARQLQLTGALQCDANAGYWQFNGQSYAWQNFGSVTVYKNGTALAANTQITEGCPISGPTHVQYHVTFNPAKNNCYIRTGNTTYSTTSTTECVYIDYLIINNDKYTFGTTNVTCSGGKCVSPGTSLKDYAGNPLTESSLVVVAAVLDPSYNATAFNQIQIDFSNPSGSQDKVGEYIDKDNMTASFGVTAQQNYTVP